MLKGNITKSTYGGYTVSMFKGNQRVAKVNYIRSLSEAREIIAVKKKLENYKTSYPELEGIILNWRSPNYHDNETFKVKVAGFDYNVGISLVNPKDSEDTFLCYHGPLSPARKNTVKLYHSLEVYDKVYMYLADLIKRKGDVEVAALCDAVGEPLGRPTGNSPTCAFSF